MIRARHMATGEHAILQRLPGGLCLAQFDRMDHPHSHRWHLYLRCEFRVVRQHLPRTRAAWRRLREYTWYQSVRPTARRTRGPELQRIK